MEPIFFLKWTYVWLGFPPWCWVYEILLIVGPWKKIEACFYLPGVQLLTLGLLNIKPPNINCKGENRLSFQTLKPHLVLTLRWRFKKSFLLLFFPCFWWERSKVRVEEQFLSKASPPPRSFWSRLSFKQRHKDNWVSFTLRLSHGVASLPLST
jgi:hypothetical protein